MMSKILTIQLGSRVTCSERALLNLLMVKLHQLDADVLVGHHISGFDLDILLHRLQVLSLTAMSVEFVNEPWTELITEQYLKCGRGSYITGKQSGKQHVVENRKTETLPNASTERRGFNLWLWCKPRSPNMLSWPSPLWHLLVFSRALTRGNILHLTFIMWCLTGL
jgi:hypothetical protein